MKNAIYSLILLSVTAITITACNQREDCAGFNETLFNTWFPYETGTAYSFVSSDGRREVLAIDEKDYTDAYSINHGKSPSYTAQCDVHGEMRALTDKNKPDEVRMRLHHSQMFAGMNSDYVVLEFRDSKEFLLDAKEHTLNGKHERGSSQFSVQKIQSLDANGKTYSDVVHITTTDEAEATRAGLKDIYIAINHGIIGYRTYPDTKEYWKE